MPGDQGVSEIKASSISNPAATDTTLITTTAFSVTDFTLNPSMASQEGHPGEVLTYTLLITNIGTFEDSYNIEISATWQTTGPLTLGPLQPDESGVLIVTVTVPQGAMAGDQDDAILTITSQGDQLVSHQVTLTSTAIWYHTLLPLALKN
jgi:uncharacterized membrane protein